MLAEAIPMALVRSLGEGALIAAFPEHVQRGP